jgi:hypothetical protein
MTTRHTERIQHPHRRLGRRPRDPARPLLKLGDYLTGNLPAYPLAVDYFTRVPKWRLGRNGEFGTCGPTSLANLALLVSTWLTESPVTITDDQIIDLYRRSGNPTFDPTTGEGDNGVDMTVMLAAAVKDGIGPVKPLAFALVNGHSPEETWAAGALFGGALWGADLDVAQQHQTDLGLWNYTPSSEWGGHAVMAAGRFFDKEGTTRDRTGLVSWAEVLDSTDTFITNQVTERYVVIFPWHLGERTFQQGLDLGALARDYQLLTGRPFPAAPPTPKPPPEFVDVNFANEVRDWANARHVGANGKAAAATKRWLAAKTLETPGR